MSSPIVVVGAGHNGRGLYVSGAGTNPSGGILGTPGQGAARAVLHGDA